MNNRGQILVLFIIFVPLIISIAAMVIDLGHSYSNTSKLDSINKMVIKYGLENIDNDNVKEEMIDLIYKNDSSIDEYELIIKDNKITLEIKKSIDSVFGNIIGIKVYYLSSKYQGYRTDNKIVIEKG
jgi:hypothetical protein